MTTEKAQHTKNTCKQICPLETSISVQCATLGSIMSVYSACVVRLMTTLMTLMFSLFANVLYICMCFVLQCDELS